MRIQVSSAHEADRLWRRLPALRHALGRDWDFEVLGPDGEVLEDFTDAPADRARALLLWMELMVARASPPPAPAP
jgi:hypothetical protein